MHGGGNTSLKHTTRDIFGGDIPVLYVKGSGWDLATIEAAGFAPVRLEVLQKLATFESLRDSEIVYQQRAALTDPNAPNPSVEAILHAIIPYTFVDHTHTDALVTLTNTPQGPKIIQEIYGGRVLVLPYIMPGFPLARQVYTATQNFSRADWDRLEGIILLKHGLFTFADEARASYETMIRLVDEAEQYLQKTGAWAALAIQEAPQKADPLALSAIRRAASEVAQMPLITLLNDSGPAQGFAQLSQAAAIATRGPITPDHVIRTKAIPVILGPDPARDIDEFKAAYEAYFRRNTDGQLTMLDPAPRWGVWQGRGVVSFGETVGAAQIVADISTHTIQAIQWAEALGGWSPLPERDLFEMEYWELEQAKLKKSGARPPFQGKIALVTGAASGIGLACARMLAARGAAVVGLDVNPQITEVLKSPGQRGWVCDLTDPQATRAAIEATVRAFGGLDILVSNAGIFPPSYKIESMDSAVWDKSLAVNLSSHQILLQAALPYLKNGWEATAILIGSRNATAPGPGAAAYSVAKAGLTQLARVAALEWAEYGVRVNVIHPDAVFDTGIWTDEILHKRAANYGLSVQAYKTRNLLKTEITSADVAEMVCAMAGPAFSKTTGAQVPVDGGNERVI
jgi:rhamnose utilization protein RhaD (predicted bifunctional aldolase and dehydrogenase)/NAD(P)-dependent dehydrogenase (short-subunit alcohol dehydrogenase family)